MSVRLVLASASPRRRELLGRLGLDFEVEPAEIDESPAPGEPGPLHALRVAREKAAAVAARLPGAAVLGADTAVVLGDSLLGKPAGAADARLMLASLRGRSHAVVTAVALRFAGREAEEVAVTRVTFTAFSDGLLDWYTATGEGADKAGAYAVQGQGALLVQSVEGNVQAVVGLPLAPLPRLFAAVGLRLVPAGDRLVLEAWPAAGPYQSP